MFKGLGNLDSMMREAQQMGGRMQEINDSLKTQRATGSAGAGLVEAEVNGLGEMLCLRIDPSLIDKGDREMIEDLVPAAVNQAQAKAKELHVEAMKSMTSGFDMPGLNEAISQLTGSQDSKA